MSRVIKDKGDNKTMNKLSKITLALLAFCGLSFAQTGFTTTTLTNALTARGTAGTTGTQGNFTIVVGSTTGMYAPGVNPSYGSIGSPTAPNITYLLVDRELMRVNAVPSTTTVSVERGVQGTKSVAHNASATVYVAYANQLLNSPPTGACTAATFQYMPQYSFTDGNFYTCATSGPNANLWTIYNSQTYQNLQDGEYFIPWSDCVSSVSGNSSGTNGQTTAGGNPVDQASTSASGTNTQTYICALKAPSRTTANKGVYITGVNFYYGVQTNALGTQASVAASGTFNGTTVFTKIVMPAAGASETPSTVSPVRADSGSLVYTPAAASANTATTSAGAFYTQTFTPATPFALSDNTQYFVNVTFQAAATTATITNTPGLLIHYNIDYF